MKKNAIVTGGRGGIGTHICRQLRDAGYNVITSYLYPGNTEKWVSDPDNHDITCEYIDVRDYDSCEKAMNKIHEEHGPISILVNNAGITRDSQLKKMSLEQWNEVISSNLNSVFNMSRLCINDMLDQKWGRVINISSINGQKGQFGQTNYSAAKAGMHGFTMALAQEVARHGITVNTVSPGYTATPMVSSMREDILDSIVAQIPKGRLASPEEIAKAVLYLCSDDAEFITGGNLPVNGGQFISF